MQNDIEEIEDYIILDTTYSIMKALSEIADILERPAHRFILGNYQFAKFMKEMQVGKGKKSQFVFFNGKEYQIIKSNKKEMAKHIILM